MKKLLLSACLYVIVLTSVLAQSSAAVNKMAWHEGEVISKSGDTLHCTLRVLYVATTHVFQIMHEGEPVNINPDRIRSFSLSDSINGKIRRFVSVDLKGETDRSVFMLSLYENEHLEILAYKTVGIPYDYMQFTGLISKPVPVTQRFVLDKHNSELNPLSRASLLKILAERDPEKEIYAKLHRRTFKKTADYIQVLQHRQNL